MSERDREKEREIERMSERDSMSVYFRENEHVCVSKGRKETKFIKSFYSLACLSASFYSLNLHDFFSFFMPFFLSVCAFIDICQWKFFFL